MPRLSRPLSGGAHDKVRHAAGRTEPAPRGWCVPAAPAGQGPLMVGNTGICRLSVPQQQQPPRGEASATTGSPRA
jgi:hypothetical protein